MDDRYRDVKVALIGCGRWGRNIARTLAELGALGMVCDSDAEVRAWASGLGQGEVVDSVDAVWDSNIKLVVIAAPTEAHLRLGCQAITAGKDVLVEKPLADTYEGAATLCERAERARAFLAVGHVLLYHGGFYRALRMAHDGELGNIETVWIDNRARGQIRPGEDVLLSLGPHYVALALRWLGAGIDKAPSLLVAAHGDWQATPGPGIVNATVFPAALPGGAPVHLTLSWRHPDKVRRLQAIGTDGAVVVDEVAGRLTCYKATAGAVPFDEGREIEYDRTPPLRRELECFIKQATEGAESDASGRHGAYVVAILEAMRRAAASRVGTPVYMKP